MNTKSFGQDMVKAFIIAFLVLFPHFVPLPFYSYAIICFAVIVIYLRRHNKTLRDLGLKIESLTTHTFFIGVLTALIWIAFNKWVYHPFITHFFVIEPYTEYDFIRKKLLNLIFTLIAAWIVGGLYEEIVFRGFIQITIREWLVKSRHSFWLAGVLTSSLFGVYHWQQGIFGIITTALGGLFWTFLLWRYKGNLWYPIISHAVFDTIALTMIYFGITI
ncbi:MAG TPA: type II CAAX endopeptidase family protein [Chitinophagaceae bacterium]|nr:type II CAAX endopeptidase family protein [Chitinophagaceae bacterium]